MGDFHYLQKSVIKCVMRSLFSLSEIRKPFIRRGIVSFCPSTPAHCSCSFLLTGGRIRARELSARFSSYVPTREQNGDEKSNSPAFPVQPVPPAKHLKRKVSNVGEAQNGLTTTLGSFCQSNFLLRPGFCWTSTETLCK